MGMGSVTRTPTRGRYVGMGERDEDADKGRYIPTCGNGTRRYAQVQTGAWYPMIALSLSQSGRPRTQCVR